MVAQTLTSDRFDFDDAAEAMEFCFERGWTDGLPVVPPTPEKVARLLDAAGPISRGDPLHRAHQGSSHHR